MKKIFNLSVLMAMLAMVLTACAPTEVDDLFDDTAANRLDKAVQNYRDYFTSNGGKWEMLYFANADEMGYYFVVTLRKDGSVTISGHNKFIVGGGSSPYRNVESNEYKSETSIWDLTADDGPSLSFCSLNGAFHFFCDPGKIPPGSSRANGAGHEGDFEFNIISTTDDQAILRGKKHGMEVVMNRLPADTDDATRVAQFVSNTSTHFSADIKTLYLTASTGERFVLSDYEASLPGNSEMVPDLTKFWWLIVPENGDPVTDREHMALMVTATGLHFLNPLEFLPEYSVGANVVQDFTFQPDGTLLGDDGVTTISAGPATTNFMDPSRNWKLDMNSMSDGLKTALDNLVAGMKELRINNRRVTSVSFTDISINRVVASAETEASTYLSLTFSLKVATSNASYNPMIKLEMVRVDDKKIKLVYNPDAPDTFDSDGIADKFLRPVPAFDEFMRQFTDGEIEVIPASMMNPTSFTLSLPTGETVTANLKK